MEVLECVAVMMAAFDAYEKEVYLNMVWDCTPGSEWIALRIINKVPEQIAQKWLAWCASRSLSFHFYLPALCNLISLSFNEPI